MSLYKDWQELMNNQTEETIEKFWDEYSSAEKRIYDFILKDHEKQLSGKIDDLAVQFDCDKVIFMGFLDGIQTSLNNPTDLDNLNESAEVSLDIDFEKLFFNMLKADAAYLYTLESWDNVLSEDERQAILKDFKRSKIVHVEKKPGRNDPCPCGSGKKYKKCCGKNA